MPEYFWPIWQVDFDFPAYPGTVLCYSIFYFSYKIILLPWYAVRRGYQVGMSIYIYLEVMSMMYMRSCIPVEIFYEQIYLSRCIYLYMLYSYRSDSIHNIPIVYIVLIHIYYCSCTSAHIYTATCNIYSYTFILIPLLIHI